MHSASEQDLRVLTGDTRVRGGGLACCLWLPRCWDFHTVGFWVVIVCVLGWVDFFLYAKNMYQKGVPHPHTCHYLNPKDS